MFEAGMVQTLVEGVRDTLYMVLASTAFGYLLGLPLGILLCITAALATLRLIYKAFFCIKFLFSCSEYELRSAILAY